MYDELLNFNMPAVVSGTSYTTSDDYSDDVIDLEAVAPALGQGNPVRVKVICTTDVTQTGTLAFSLEGDADAAFSGATTLLTGATFTNAAGADAGDVLMDMALPNATERYLRIKAAIATGNVTAGGFDAFLYVE